VDRSTDPSAVVVALEEARRRLRGDTRPLDENGRPRRDVDDWFAEQDELEGALDAAPPPPVPDRIDLNAAGFDDLRAAGLSVTQAKRFLAHREGIGGFRSLDQLDSVPGFPRELIAELQQRATV
jgi:hypothetical protein